MVGAAPVVGRWLWMLADARQRTLRSLRDLPDEAVDWEAPEGGNSIGTLLAHLAAIEMDWLFSEVQEAALPPAILALLPPDVRDPDGRLVAVHGMPLAVHLDRLAQTRAVLVKALQGMTTAELRRLRHLPEMEVTPEWVLHHLLQHEAEHRGELGVIRAHAEQALGSPLDERAAARTQLLRKPVGPAAPNDAVG
jgi:uncharacterized damage-inducible protein DinB